MNYPARIPRDISISCRYPELNILSEYLFPPLHVVRFISVGLRPLYDSTVIISELNYKFEEIYRLTRDISQLYARPKSISCKRIKLLGDRQSIASLLSRFPPLANATLNNLTVSICPPYNEISPLTA